MDGGRRRSGSAASNHGRDCRRSGVGRVARGGSAGRYPAGSGLGLDDADQCIAGPWLARGDRYRSEDAPPDPFRLYRFGGAQGTDGMRWVAAIVFALATAPTLAAEPVYLDDRSTAVSVIQSFYNAISRKEYARSYSYYEDGQGVGPFAKFVAGYADTASVSIAFGQVGSEGAAGSTYYT